MVSGQCLQNTGADHSSVPNCNLKRTVQLSEMLKLPLLSLSLPYPAFISHSQNTLYPATISITLHQTGLALPGLFLKVIILDTNLERFGSARPGLQQQQLYTWYPIQHSTPRFPPPRARLRSHQRYPGIPAAISVIPVFPQPAGSSRYSRSAPRPAGRSPGRAVTAPGGVRFIVTLILILFFFPREK